MSPIMEEGQRIPLAITSEQLEELVDKEITYLI